jgi:hypothetical protein
LDIHYILTHTNARCQAKTISGCLSTAQILNELRRKYKQASLLIGSLCTELTITSASLSQIQDLLDRDGDDSGTPAVRPELLETFDTALVGCMVVLSCIEDEVHRFNTLEPGLDGLSRMDKVKVAWKDDTLRELATQLRGQQTAMTLLVQTLQM